MLPMVSQVDEVLKAKALLQEALDLAKREYSGWSAAIQFGIMIEVPSAVLIIEHFAPHVDFFSIGTNDLTQYTMAVDRMNGRVAGLASPFHPAVLKLVEHTVRVAHQHGKWVGMCGELAGDPLAVPFLLGIVLDEFSMTSASIPKIKQTIRTFKVTECQAIAVHVLQLPDAAQVIDFLRNLK